MAWTAADEKVLQDLQAKRNRAFDPLREWLQTRANVPIDRPGEIVPMSSIDMGTAYRQEAVELIIKAIARSPREMQELLRPFLGDS